jgi:hypothetical protein
MRLGRHHRLRWLTTVGLLTLVALVLLAVLAPHTQASGPPPCPTATLRLDRVGGQGFTSHRQWDFAVRNVSAESCRLRGYPAASWLDARARVISGRVDHHASGSPLRTVLLQPWARAYFSFVFVTGAVCAPHRFSAYGLRISPPGSHGHLVYYAGPTDVCAPSRGGPPSITAVSAHRAG